MPSSSHSQDYNNDQSNMADTTPRDQDQQYQQYEEESRKGLEDKTVIVVSQIYIYIYMYIFCFGLVAY